MFKKLAAEALGLSDIGIIVPKSDYDKVDADDYLFHEDGESIFFLIKSKKDEYCFTNLALIHVDGDSAVSSKRTVKRYDYANNRISFVRIETAGNMDLDVELKFGFTSGEDFSIDIRKDHLEAVKDIYKTLRKIASLQYEDEVARNNAQSTLGAVAQIFKVNSPASPETINQTFDALLANLNHTILVKHTRKDFGEIFDRYIKA